MARTADLILRNGRISTEDPARPEAAALAVSAGRIIAVGDEGDVAALIGPGTRVVDTLGHRVIPGLSDSHIYLSGPREGCRTRGAGGFRRVGVPGSSVRQQAQRPGELGALGGQLAGGPGRPLRVAPGSQPPFRPQPIEVLGEDVRGDPRGIWPGRSLNRCGPPGRDPATSGVHRSPTLPAPGKRRRAVLGFSHERIPAAGVDSRAVVSSNLQVTSYWRYSSDDNP